MEFSLADVTFKQPERQQLEMIVDWFKKPHVSEYFDDPVTGRSIADLKNFIEGKDFFWTPWLACYDGKPFAYFMAAEVAKHETGIWSKWREKKGKTYSLDMFIAEEVFLGKGIAHLLIQKLITDQFQHAAAFLIDPELRNIRAIHVYEKVGFVIVDEFKGEHGRFAGIPHVMMKKKMKK